jgi:predicted DNA binding protein
MTTFKKKDLNELVGGDINSDGGDRNVTNNSEIETGPVQKSFNDTSDYEKGQSPTTDKVASRYRQDIPWFAVYSFGGTRSSGSVKEAEKTEKSVVIKKNTVEEKIEDLVKKSKDSEVTQKGNNPKVNKLIDTIKDCDLTDKQLEDLANAILDKKNNPKKIKNI